jgi:hypothetical protein
MLYVLKLFLKEELCMHPSSGANEGELFKCYKDCHACTSADVQGPTSRSPSSQTQIQEEFKSDRKLETSTNSYECRFPQ